MAASHFEPLAQRGALPDRGAATDCRLQALSLGMARAPARRGYRVCPASLSGIVALAPLLGGAFADGADPLSGGPRSDRGGGGGHRRVEGEEAGSDLAAPCQRGPVR